MSKPTYTLNELIERSVRYFESNTDVEALLATTSGAKFYRPEFESYANHYAATNGGEVLVIHREAIVRPVGAPLFSATIDIRPHLKKLAQALMDAETKKATAQELAEVVATATVVPGYFAAEAKPAGLSELVATATVVPGYFAPEEPAAPAAPTEPKPKRTYKPRAAKAAPAPKKKASTKSAE